MADELPESIRRRIEQHVDELLRGVDLTDAARAEARGDFVEHLETETRLQVARGTPPEQAADHAFARFGNRDLIRRQLGALADGGGFGGDGSGSAGGAGGSGGFGRGGSAPAGVGPGPAGRGGSAQPARGPLAAIARWCGDVAQDLRFAVRTMRLEPGFTAMVVLTIALGIAATTTIFSVVDGILLRRLAYPEPDRIVAIWPSFWFSNSSFEILQRDLDLENGSFFAIAASSPRDVRYRDADGVRTIGSRRVTARFLEVLGPVMTAGRTFDPDANELGSERTVVLTDGFWRRELAGDPAIVGKTIALDGTEHTIIGVLAPGYDLFGPDVEVVLPKVFDRDQVRYRSDEMKALGRLRPGVTLAQAGAELEAVVAGWKEQYGLDADFGDGFHLVPLRDFMVGDIRSTVWLLFGAVTLILLISLANVASLLVTRSIARQREVSVRLAVGARSLRIVRQLLTESTVLGVLGGVGGLLASFFGVRAVVELMPPDTPRLTAIGLDMRVVMFATAVSLATGWLIAIAPALRLVSSGLRGPLNAGDRGTTSRQRVRRMIVATEIGLAVTLLIGAGLLVKSFARLNETNPGVRPAGLVTFYAGAQSGRISSHGQAEVFHRQVRERLAALPGVSGVATISQAPFNLDGGVVGCRAFEESAPDAANQQQCRWRTVLPDYFEIAGTELVEGRAFNDDDTAGAEPVAVISRTAARALFPGRSAVGERVATGFESVVDEGLPWATVIGVVDDVRFLGLAEEAPLLVYRPEVQAGDIIDRFGFFGNEYLIRAEPGALSLEAVRSAVRAVDPYAVVTGFRSMRQLIAASIADRRAVLILMSAFTFAAVCLAIIGIYGVTAHAVRSRSRELGIKMALGASGRALVAEVFHDGLEVAAVGAALGLALALSLARFIESFLYGVTSSDPWVMASAIALAVAVALGATWVPARRASAADPVEALTAD